jgi:hypothetical protein
MISYKHLLEIPQEYQPLSTNKGIRNLANKPSFTQMDMNDVFKSEANQLMLSRNLYNISKRNGGRSNLQKFVKLVPLLQQDFCKTHNLNETDMVESGVTGQKDWVLILKAINNMFIKKCYDLFRWNAFVPTRESTMVGATGNRKMKKLSELLAHDIPTVDVWEDVDQNRNNSQYWLDNKIPIWRESISRRWLDKSNEGLRDNNPDRASLENFQRGFDQSTIFSIIDNWTTSGWFGY